MITGWGEVSWNLGVQAGEVIAATRTHLDDDDGTLWPDQRVLPKLQEAHRLLQLKLVTNGAPLVNSVSEVLSVPAGTVDLSVVHNYPRDMLNPVWMKERLPGQQDQDFVDMTEVDFIPSLQPSTELIWWCWREDRIYLLGSTSDREVLLRYLRTLRVPQTMIDPIGVPMAESYLSFKTAQLILSSVSNPDVERITMLRSMAEESLQDLLSSIALEAQNLPTKRRPYHRGRGRSRVLRDF